MRINLSVVFNVSPDPDKFRVPIPRLDLDVGVLVGETAFVSWTNVFLVK